MAINNNRKCSTNGIQILILMLNRFSFIGSKVLELIKVFNIMQMNKLQGWQTSNLHRIMPITSQT